MTLPVPLILSEKRYFVHLRDKAVEALTREDVRRLGARVFQSLTDDVDIVITDHSSVRKCINGKIERRRRLSLDGIDESSLYNCSAAVVPKETACGQNHVSVSSTSQPALKTNGSRHPSGQNEKLANLPPLLKKALVMGLTIMPYQEFIRSLKTHERKTTLRRHQAMAPTKKSLGAGPAKVKIFRLRKPYIKIEDRARQYRPVVERLDYWPRINPDTKRKGCIFADDRSKAKNQQDHASKSSSSALPVGLPKRKRKAARKLDFDKAQTESQRKTDSTGLTQTIEPRHYDERRNARPGYCELCNCRADNLTEHFASEGHKRHFASGIYQSLDEEIALGTTLDRFIADALSRATSDNKATTSTTSPKPSPRRHSERQPSISTASPNPSPRRPLGIQQGISMRSPSFISPSRLRSPRPAPPNPSQSPSSGFQLSFPIVDSASPYIARVLKIKSLGNERLRVKRNLTTLK